MIKVPSSLFQSRAQGLMKQVQDLHEQLEQTYVECTTFENLRQHEIGAIPKRMEVGGNNGGFLGALSVFCFSLIGY